jgi:hypothetical protein
MRCVRRWAIRYTSRSLTRRRSRGTNQSSSSSSSSSSIQSANTPFARNTRRCCQSTARVDWISIRCTHPFSTAARRSSSGPAGKFDYSCGCMSCLTLTLVALVNGCMFMSFLFEASRATPRRFGRCSKLVYTYICSHADSSSLLHHSTFCYGVFFSLCRGRRRRVCQRKSERVDQACAKSSG